MNQRAEIDVRNIFAIVVVAIISVYVAYAMISAFVKSDPSFGIYGWPILGALVVGVIAFFKTKLFS